MDIIDLAPPESNGYEQMDADLEDYIGKRLFYHGSRGHHLLAVLRFLTLWRFQIAL